MSYEMVRDRVDVGGRKAKVLQHRARVRAEGLGMAARAGAELADLEFVQFHPTAMDVGVDPEGSAGRVAASRSWPQSPST